MTNPDFTRIKDNKFEYYYYEPFTKNFPKHSKSFELWKKGMQNNQFWPQYQGREHINVYQWTKNL
jgi:hypothetical protein